MIVRLTWAEMAVAYQVAGQRRIMNMKTKIPPKHGAPTGEKGELLDLVSCRGEMAVAKYLNLYWSGTVGDYGAVDVGGKVEVRTGTKRGHRLILHKTDLDHLPFVLALHTEPPAIELIGWVYAREGKQEEYWSDPAKEGRWAYFVPQDVLRPMSELSAALADAA